MPPSLVPLYGVKDDAVRWANRLSDPETVKDVLDSIVRLAGWLVIVRVTHGLSFAR